MATAQEPLRILVGNLTPSDLSYLPLAISKRISNTSFKYRGPSHPIDAHSNSDFKNLSSYLTDLQSNKEEEDQLVSLEQASTGVDEDSERDAV